MNDLEKRIEQLEHKIDHLVDLVTQLVESPVKKKNQTVVSIEKLGEPTQKPVTQPKDAKKEEMKQTITEVYALYKVKINKRSRLITKAEQKIKARLKEYSVDQLKKAIEHFSADDWWMTNNAHRGVAWFFHSEDRVEQFLNLKPQKRRPKYELSHNEQPCKLMENRLKIFAPWTSTWLDWNKNHPQFEKFILKDDGKLIAKGKDAYDEFIKFFQ